MPPAPTPYTPAEYSTLSAGTFNGKPLIEVLHSFPHFGSDDYEARLNAGYKYSILQLQYMHIYLFRLFGHHYDVDCAHIYSILIIRFSGLQPTPDPAFKRLWKVRCRLLRERGSRRLRHHMLHVGHQLLRMLQVLPRYSSMLL